MVIHLLLVFFAVVVVRAYVPPVSIPPKTGISDELLATFNLMEQYAAAAYCFNNHNSPGDKLRCPPGNCPLVQSAEAKTLIEFQSELDTDVTGYVAVDDVNKYVVIAFRGSASAENWATNFDFDFVDSDLCDGCRAHKGFWQSWLDSRIDILGVIKDIAITHPAHKLVVVGHSLGAAIATLSAADLRRDGYNATLYSFGSPRVANKELSEFISDQLGGNYRVTHWQDPVPRVPPSMLGYRHITPEYYINKQRKKEVGPADVQICEGANNKKCNGKWGIFELDWRSHTWYFNGVADCLP